MTLEGIDHVAISVRNQVLSMEWYRDVLGLERRHERAWGDYPIMMCAGTTCVAIFPMTENPESPNSAGARMLHLAFRANRGSFESAKNELRDRGISFEFQDHEIAHSIYFSDPDGHRLEITTYEV